MICPKVVSGWRLEGDSFLYTPGEMCAPNSSSHVAYDDRTPGPPEQVSPCLYPCQKSLPGRIIFYLVFQCTKGFLILFGFLFLFLFVAHCWKHTITGNSRGGWGNARHFKVMQNSLISPKFGCCLFAITGSSLHESLIPALGHRQPVPASLHPAAHPALSSWRWLQNDGAAEHHPTRMSTLSNSFPSYTQKHCQPMGRFSGGYYTLQGEKGRREELRRRFWERSLEKDHWDRDREA